MSHEVRNGDGTTETVSCEEYSAYVERHSWYERARTLSETLRYLADLHHRTLTGSKKHDPENVVSFEDCECLTCRKATDAIRSAGT